LKLKERKTARKDGNGKRCKERKNKKEGKDTK
jgi:hypothetical protein